jgi:5,10-methylene-tetrahydrofolate dehydrogenase/methenyl tetrahydrofolate cyclohydrolase
MAQILDGLKISNEIKQEIKAEVDKIKAVKEFLIFLQF